MGRIQSKLSYIAWSFSHAAHIPNTAQKFTITKHVYTIYRRDIGGKWRVKQLFLLKSRQEYLQKSYKVKEKYTCVIVGFRCGWIEPSVFWVITLFTDVSELHIGPIFKDQAAQEAWTLGGPETSVSNHLKPRNNLEDGRIHKYTCLIRHDQYKHCITLNTSSRSSGTATKPACSVVHKNYSYELHPPPPLSVSHNAQFYVQL
jgi:hypothetical protein